MCHLKTPNAKCGVMNDELKTVLNLSFRIHHSSLLYRVDLDRRVVLPVALRALVLLAALLLEDDDLRAAAVVYDRARHLRALDRRVPDLYARVAAADDERFELDRVARLRVERGHADGAAIFDAELFAAGAYDCVSHFLYSSHTGGLTRPRKVLHYKGDSPARPTVAAPYFMTCSRRPVRPDFCSSRRTAP